VQGLAQQVVPQLEPEPPAPEAGNDNSAETTEIE
jgi:hypothetical protein